MEKLEFHQKDLEIMWVFSCWNHRNEWNCLGRRCGRKAVKGGILKILIFKEWRINKCLWDQIGKQGHIKTSWQWCHGNLMRKIHGKWVSDARENDALLTLLLSSWDLEIKHREIIISSSFPFPSILLPSLPAGWYGYIRLLGISLVNRLRADSWIFLSLPFLPHSISLWLLTVV